MQSGCNPKWGITGDGQAAEDLQGAADPQGTKDPEWKASVPIRCETVSHYALRPRHHARKYDEGNDDEMDDDKLVKPGSPEDELVITISQTTKRHTRRGGGGSKANPSPPPVNDVLPCIPFPVNTFADLVRLSGLIDSEKTMFKDCQRLPALLPVLRELDAMIGLQGTKNAICSLILSELKNVPANYRHMVITGPPGVGKSSIASIIAKILNRLGRVPSDEVTRGSPLNMMSEYMGGTNTMVEKLVQEARSKSGVLLIDEAHSLNDGSTGGQNISYGRECINQLMALMDEYRTDLVVIFAGYRREMEANVLQVNEGLKRRIAWMIHMDAYSPDELAQIFRQKVTDCRLQCKSGVFGSPAWFAAHPEDFPYFGGSIDNLVHKIRTVFMHKTFGFDVAAVLTDEVLEEGYRMYMALEVEPIKAMRAEHQQQRQQHELAVFGGLMPFGRRSTSMFRR